MEAIILAGGFGTRLRQIVPDCPKPMAPIGGRPFLEILLEALARKGFKRVILSLGFMAEKISSHFGSHYAGMEVVCVVEDSSLGTGGAVRLAMLAANEDHVFIFNGDTFLDLEVARVELLWQRVRQPIIVAHTVANTARYGRLLVDDDGIVVGFAEKGVEGPGFINAGCYVLAIDALKDFAIGSAFSLESDFFLSAVKSMLVTAFVTKGKFIDIGVPEDYERAQTELANC